jgi:hypothetical protein
MEKVRKARGWFADQVVKFGVAAGVLALLMAGMLASTAVGQQAATMNCAVNTADPSYTNGTIRLCSLTTTGALRVSGVAGGGAFVVGGPAADDAAASGNPVPVGGIYNTTLPTYTNLDRTQAQFSQRGQLAVSIFGLNQTVAAAVASQSGDGAASDQSLLTDTRLRLMNGSSTWDRARSVINATDSTGTGIAAAGLLGQCDDTAPTATTENQFGNLRRDCATAALATEIMPTTASTAAIAPNATAAAASSLVLKASAGNLYGVQVTTGASAGIIYVFNATSLPGNGAVTPVKCYVVGANTTLEKDYRPGPPLRLATGITIGFGTGTNCFDLTASATAFISGEAL